MRLIIIETCNIRPVAIYRDPFRRGKNVLVMCETYTPEGEGRITPVNHMPRDGTWGVNGNNNRATALEVFNNPAVKDQKPWYVWIRKDERWI